MKKKQMKRIRIEIKAPRKHLNRNLKNILTPHQHDFVVVGKSTITNLTEYTFAITNAMSIHKHTDSIYLDLSKAFDSVRVNLLIDKLRQQHLVRIGYDKTSDPINVTSRIGQGYPISSSLFNRFLFDLPFFLLKMLK